MKVFSLTADAPLIKEFNGKNISPYPMAYRFTSKEHEVKHIEDLHKVILATAAEQGCLLKGHCHIELKGESRAGATVTTDATQWLCFDLDKVSTYKTPDEFMKDIGLGDVSYIVQYSSSYGIEINGTPYDTRLSCHIFVMMEEEVSAPLIKEWLKHLNFNTERLRSDMELTKTKCALSWPLDITTCQNDKLLYVAPPACKGGAKDKLNSKRISIVKRKKEFLELPDFPGPEKNRLDQEATINLLRAAEGLERRGNSTNLKVHNKSGTSYLDRPGEAAVTGVKEARGYVYLNLNGGNSWGYYHPEDDFEFIYNFKGEPTYMTKQLLPDYYEQKAKELWKSKVVHEGARELEDGSQRVIFAFREKASDSYYNGILYADGYLDLHPTGSKDKLADFLAQYDLNLPPIIEDWEIIYSPTTKERYNKEEKWVNRYCPGEVVPVKGAHPTISAVLTHALGCTDQNDPLVSHFMNWLAFIYQYGELTKTAWLLHGTQGTGKGTLYTHVLKPLFGVDNVKEQGTKALTAPYNEFLKHTQLLLIDEAQLHDLSDGESVNENIKMWITEPTVRVREMYRRPEWVNNFCNWLFFSNSDTPLVVPDNDRRFNIANYQKQPLKNLMTVNQQLFNTLAQEMPAFAFTIANWPVNEEAAHTCMETEAKEELKALTATNSHAAYAAIRAGDLEFFLNELPALDEFISPVQKILNDNAYEAILQIRNKYAALNFVPREILQALVEMVRGERFKSSNTFTRTLAKYQIGIEALHDPSTRKTVRGARVTWHKLGQDEQQEPPKVESKVTTKAPAKKPAAPKPSTVTKTAAAKRPAAVKK